MLAVVRLVVEPGDAGVQRPRIRRRECVRTQVEPIAEGRAVCRWIKAEVTQHVRIDARTPGAGSVGAAVRIHGRNLRWIQCHYSPVADVFHVSSLEGGEGSGARDLAVFRGALPFIVAEEEELVLLDGTAEGGAEGVTDELARNVGLTGR